MLLQTANIISLFTENLISSGMQTHQGYKKKENWRMDMLCEHFLCFKMLIHLVFCQNLFLLNNNVVVYGITWNTEHKPYGPHLF